MSGEDAPRPYLENLIVLEIKTKQTKRTEPSYRTEPNRTELFIEPNIGSLVQEIKTNVRGHVLPLPPGPAPNEPNRTVQTHLCNSVAY
jgi:hypothetical protein